MEFTAIARRFGITCAAATVILVAVYAERDPNVTDSKLPGNPIRSSRSTEPLEVVGEVTDWTRLTRKAFQLWRDRLAAILDDERGEIIN